MSTAGQRNLILAGVGGQGILTIAQVLSQTALRRGWQVKQAEVHGMSQRGGAVQSHLRFADHPIHSDLVPRGTADAILAVEPLEAQRYVDYLAPDGAIVASTAALVNIPNYPPIEAVLRGLARYHRHVLVDAPALGRSAGSARAANMALLGAAADIVGFELAELEQSITELFERKGAEVVRSSIRALRYGHHAGRLYGEALRRGAESEAVRQWLDRVPAADLATAALPDATLLSLHQRGDDLSAAEEQALAATLEQVTYEARDRLREHEVYAIMELVGAISPPRHLFLERDHAVTPEMLDAFEGDTVVLKVVSPDIVHKSDAGAVVFTAKVADLVNREAESLRERHTAAGHAVDGLLLVQYVPHDRTVGSELFVGIRATREFGPVIAAGLGGLDTEYLATKMKPGIAVAKAAVLQTSAEAFFEQFRGTAAYDILSGQVRGHRRMVDDGELLRCFRAFIAIARHLAVWTERRHRGLVELEVNPFAFIRGRLLPLDGRGRLGELTPAAPGRPLHAVRRLLEPRSIAVSGVSAERRNFGRIILENITACGFPREHLYVVKQHAGSIDGIRCLADIRQVPEDIDLWVVATAAQSAPALINDAIASGTVGAVILISGGVGETAGSRRLLAELQAAIQQGRSGHRGPVVLGGNSMGVRSRPGAYDTFFIDPQRLDPRRDQPSQRVALLSQSGAFMITRMSNLPALRPAIAVSVGNQIDLTISDLLQTVGARNDIDCVGVYVEGFRDLDGLAFLRAVRALTAAGKEVIFYKAGRTPQGRSATEGHTASIAGDYDVCQAAAAQAGAVVVDTFKEFEQLLELATAFHGKPVHGRRIGVISNAGYETVGMADALIGARYQVEMPPLTDGTRRRVAAVLEQHGLAHLVNVRNPLDLTPMADDDVYQACTDALVAADEFDAVVVSIVPMTERLLALPNEIKAVQSIATRLPRLCRTSAKPVVAVIDSGAPFEPLAAALREAGVPVFCSSDQAIRSLGRYLCHRAARVETSEAPPPAVGIHGMDAVTPLA